MPHTTPLFIAAAELSLTDVVRVARDGAPVRLADAARAAIARSRTVVESAAASGDAHYGINTGFGSLARQRIDAADVAALQRNLIRSHAAGIGDPLPREVVRAMMLLLAASLARGLSGVRPELVDLILALLNSGITPVVPSIGSVGASGDLAPLAAVGLVLIGEGLAYTAQSPHSPMPAGAALAAANLAPITLQAKEGLAIINGTHLMAAQAALLCADFEPLFDAALAAAAMSMDAARATDTSLDARLHAARRQPGQEVVAARLRGLLAGSQIVESHREGDPRVQDPYSLRCTPQVLGAVADTFAHVRAVVERELGAVTDNPLVLVNNIVSGGNFHGMPLAIALDTLAIAITHIAGISERRTFWLLAGHDPESHLHPYLAGKPGLHSGLMIAQYTAAACCNEIIGLAAPASVANISTSAGVEDYNSFGPRSAAKARRALDLARHVIAIEMLCAAQGIEAHRPLRSGDGVERAYARVRAIVRSLAEDRPLTPDIEAIAALIADRGLTEP